MDNSHAWYVSTFQPRNFTGWGSEGVKGDSYQPCSWHHRHKTARHKMARLTALFFNFHFQTSSFNKPWRDGENRRFPFLLKQPLPLLPLWDALYTKEWPSWPCFCNFPTSIFNIPWLDCENCCECIFYSIPVATAPYTSSLVRSPLRFSMIDWHCDSVPAYLFHSLRVVRILVRVETQSQLNRKEN